MKTVSELLAYLKIDLIQLTVLIFGTTEVFLAMINNVWLYPTGIVTVLLSMYSLFKAKLYAECLLHLYYLVMSFYGWVYWTKNRGATGLPITYSLKKDWWTTVSIVMISWAVLYFS